MSILKKLVLIFFGVFAFNFSAFSHGTFYPQTPFCPLNTSSFCHTYSGNICSFFTTQYQPAFFSGCMTIGYIHYCINLPQPSGYQVQNTCVLRGTPCVCPGYINGYYVYDPGTVI